MIIQTGKLRDIQALGGCEGERPGTEVQNRDVRFWQPWRCLLDGGGNSVQL